MATYYVWSGATGTNAGTSWTDAYTAFGSAVTAATAAGDVIKVQYTHIEELAADTTYTFTNNVNVISVNKDSSDAPTPMDVNAWIGNSTTSRAITVSGAYKLYFYGLTFRNAASTAKDLTFGGGDGSNHIYESCYIWQGSANTSSNIVLGSAAANSYVKLYKTTLRFNHANAALNIQAGAFYLENCVVSAAGTVPSILLEQNSNGGGEFQLHLIDRNQ